MSNSSSERERFEAWATPLGIDLRWIDALSRYQVYETNILFEGWLARAQLVEPQEAIAWRIRWSPTRTSSWCDMAKQPPTDEDRKACETRCKFEYAYATPARVSAQTEPPAEWVERAMKLADDYAHSAAWTVDVLSKMAQTDRAALRAHLLTAGGGK